MPGKGGNLRTILWDHASIKGPHQDETSDHLSRIGKERSAEDIDSWRDLPGILGKSSFSALRKVLSQSSHAQRCILSIEIEFLSRQNLFPFFVGQKGHNSFSMSPEGKMESVSGAEAEPDILISLILLDDKDVVAVDEAEKSRSTGLSGQGLEKGGHDLGVVEVI